MGSIEGKRVLVTGGAGFIGSHIVDQLVDAQVAEVVVIDNLIRGLRSNLAEAESRGHVTFVEGSIGDAEPAVLEALHAAEKDADQDVAKGAAASLKTLGSGAKPIPKKDAK